MMMFRRAVLATLSAFLVLASGAAAQTETTDPYEILESHYEAVGGLENLKAEETSFFEGLLSLDGLEGSIRHWQARPRRSRTEVDLGVFRQTTGDNGEVAWEVDANGKLRMEQDENALKRRRVSRLWEEYEHLDRESENFAMTFERVEGIGDTDCYVVRIANSINGDVTWEYVDTTSLLLTKSTTTRGETVTHTLYSDYREIDGVLRSFEQRIEILPIGQTQMLKITKYVANAEIDSSIFEPPTEDARDFAFVDGGSVVEIPFEFIENHLFLTVTVDCSERLWVLDTGASVTVIDAGYAGELGLEPGGSMRGQGAGNAVDVSFVTLPPFSIPGIEFDAQTVACIEIGDLFRRTGDLEIGGILGYDFLSRFVTRVDYANETLTFYDPGVFEYAGDGAVLDAPLRGNIFAVAATVDGEYGGAWTLDLGAGGVSFHYPFAEKNGLLDRDGIEGIGFGAGGRIPWRLSEYETIEFGGHVVEDPRIGTPAGEVIGAFGGVETTGNLGNRLFRHFVLYLDYERQRIIVEEGDDFGREFPTDGSGLQVWRSDGDEVEVLFVSPGTPADEAGFEDGDVIESVNGIGVEHLDGLVAIRALMREESGTKYVLGIRRDGEPKELKLKLRDLF